MRCAMTHSVEMLSKQKSYSLETKMTKTNHRFESLETNMTKIVRSF